MTDTPAHVVSAQSTIAGIFARNQHVFVAFSGGKDSMLLADLCQPWRDRLTLLWVNTGVMAPHMVDFVRRYGETYRLHEMPSPDVEESWRTHGLPAAVMPTSDLFGGHAVQPWQACCGRLRTKPMLDFLSAMPSNFAFLLGQRREDRAMTPEGIRPMLPLSVEIAFPIFDWSTDDVLAALEDRGLTLPPHYGRCFESLECLICPHPTANMTKTRLAYLRQDHPEAARTAEAGIRTTLKLTAAEMAKLNSVLA